MHFSTDRRAARCWLPLILFLLLLAPQLASPGLAPAETANKGLIWEVQGQGCTVWLAGTLHFASPQFYPLPQSMERAFARAEVLAVEADITQMDQETMQALQQMIVAPAGESLEQAIPPEAMRAFREAGVDVTPFEGLRPWYAILSAVTAHLEAMGYKAEYGLDVHFLRLAHERGMPVVELESVLGQFQLMRDQAEGDGRDGALDRGYLEYALTDIRGMDDEVKTLFTQWTRGDAAEMEKVLFSALEAHPEFQPFFDALFFERNRGMAEKVVGFLRSGKNHLVLVGAGHLVGEGSVTALLQQRGFSVRQL